MKPFQSRSASGLEGGALELAPLVIEVSALVMRRARAEGRKSGAGGLSFTQVRALASLKHTPGLSLSEMSELLGLQAPTTSKAVEELVQAGLVRRDTAADDRRRVTLRATREGERALAVAAGPVHRHLAAELESLTDDELAVVERAMELLLPLMKPAPRAEGNDDE